MDDATVEILIKARNEAQAKMAEAQAGLDLLRRAVEKFAQAETDGMTASFAYREGLNVVRDAAIEMGLSQEEMKFAVNQARDAMLIYNAAIAGGLPEMAALSAAMSGVTGEFVAQAAAAEADTAAQDGLLASLAATTGGLLAALNPMNSWVTLVAEAAVVLAPLVLALAGAVVLMTAFAAGASAMTLSLVGATGMFLTIGGAILLLDNKLGWINNSMAVFKGHLHDVGESLAKLASPAANQIVKFMDSLLPLAQSFGSGIIEWFSARLPLALSSMHSAIMQLAPDLRSFGSFLGQMFDKLSPQLVPMFLEVSRFGIGAIQGLISNLVDLSQWFQSRLPTYGPIVSQIFGGIGTAVQTVATGFGHLSDWFAQHWAEISGDAKEFSDAFGKAFGAFDLGLTPNVGAANPFKQMGEALGGLMSIVRDVGEVFAAVFGVIIPQAFAAIPAAIANIGDSFYANVEYPILSGIDNIISAINSLPGPVKAALGIGGNIPLIPLGPQYAGGGGAANPGAGRTGGAQTTPGGAGSRTTGHNITIHVNGAQTPHVTASVVARNLRKLGVT